jgi:hypothetical protein
MQMSSRNNWSTPLNGGKKNCDCTPSPSTESILRNAGVATPTLNQTPVTRQNNNNGRTPSTESILRNAGLNANTPYAQSPTTNSVLRNAGVPVYTPTTNTILRNAGIGNGSPSTASLMANAGIPYNGTPSMTPMTNVMHAGSTPYNAPHVTVANAIDAAANAVKTGNANIDPGVANDVVAAQNHLDTTGTLPTEYPSLVQQLHQNANGLPPHAANAVVAAANVVSGAGADANRVPSATPMSMQPLSNNSVTKAINSAANSVRNGTAMISPETANQVLNAQDELKATGVTPTNHSQVISNLQNESRNLPPHVVSAVNKAATDIGLPPTYAPAPNNSNGAVSKAINSAANAVRNGSATVSNATANKVLTANAYLNKHGVPPVNHPQVIDSLQQESHNLPNDVANKVDAASDKITNSTNLAALATPTNTPASYSGMSPDADAVRNLREILGNERVPENLRQRALHRHEQKSTPHVRCHATPICSTNQILMLAWVK